MPTSLLDADTSFPKLDKRQSDGEKIEAIESYLFMLLEQLRYSFRNIDESNFNEQGLQQIGKTITEPVMVEVRQADVQIAQLTLETGAIQTRVETAEGNISQVSQAVTGLTSRVTDAEGNISTLTQTATGLTTRVGDAEGNISTLQQTATGLTTRVTSAEGNISTLQQTATSLTTRVTSAEGNISTLTQTANSLKTRVTNTEGDISDLEQTANGLKTRVTNAEGSISTLQQTASSLTTRVSNAEGNITTLHQDLFGLTLTATEGDRSATLKLTSRGTQITSELIQFSGMVLFTDLSTSGATIINGNNIVTGTITAIDISGSNIYGSNFKTLLTYVEGEASVGGEIEMYYVNFNQNDWKAGGIRLDDEGSGSASEAQVRMYIYTKNINDMKVALKLFSEGNMSMEASGSIYMEAGKNMLGSQDVIRMVAYRVSILGDLYVNGVKIN